MSDQKDYSKEISYEQKASQRLRQLADKLVDDLAEYHSLIWLWGDGEGGYVFNVIKEAFYKRHGYPDQLPSNPKPRKVIPAKTRKTVFERDSYRCVKCESFEDLQIDHIYPHSKGGSDEDDNLQTLCAVCNRVKKDKIEVSA